MPSTQTAFTTFICATMAASVLLTAAGHAAAGQAAPAPVPAIAIIPQPVSLTPGTGHFRITKGRAVNRSSGAQTPPTSAERVPPAPQSGSGPGPTGAGT